MENKVKKSYNTNIYSSPSPTMEQQIQIDVMLLRQPHDEKQAQLRKK